MKNNHSHITQSEINKWTVLWLIAVLHLSQYRIFIKHFGQIQYCLYDHIVIDLERIWLISKRSSCKTTQNIYSFRFRDNWRMYRWCQDWGNIHQDTLWDRQEIPVCASNTMAKTASELIWEWDSFVGCHLQNHKIFTASVFLVCSNKC